MSEFQATNEQLLLRAIRRRRMARGLAIVVPALVAWWLLSQWVAQRWGLQSNLVRSAVLLAFMVPTIIAPRWLDGRLAHDARETPRLQWLSQEHADRYVSRSRILMVFGLGGLLLVQCVTLLGFVRPVAGYSGLDGLIGAVLTGSLCLRWRPKDFGDEGAQLRYLIAVNRACLVTLLACLGALVLDACHGGFLRLTLEAALLAGSLTLQLSLFIGERRTTTDGE